MQIISRARGGGKTTEAVKIARQAGAYLVVLDQREASRIHAENNDLRFPITFDEFLGGQQHNRIKNFVIDNADAFIEYVARRAGADTIDAITVGKADVN